MSFQTNHPLSEGYKLVTTSNDYKIVVELFRPDMFCQQKLTLRGFDVELSDTWRNGRQYAVIDYCNPDGVLMTAALEVEGYRFWGMRRGELALAYL